MTEVRTLDYDIVIVGSGPAGATLARILDGNMRVLLLDGAPKGGKPCGGLLAPDTQKALARFDLTLPKDVLVDPQIFSVKTVDLAGGKMRWYRRMYLNVSREKFDGWLTGLAAQRQNVTLCKSRCCDVKRIAEGFAVTYRQNGQTHRVTATYVVGADGADSTVRKCLFAPLKTRRYVAIQQWFVSDKTHTNPFYSCIFDRETTDCCSWSIHKDGYLIYGGAFAPQGCRAAFERQKQKLASVGFELDELDAPVRTEACQVFRPVGAGSFCCGKDGAFLLGEAAGLISPSSLEGISSAINSAVALNEALRRGGRRANALYAVKTRKLRAKLLLKNLKCPFMYVPLLRGAVLATGLNSIDLYREQ
ncbi:MAG: FAD-binding protein [Clostridia bacterium]|nr:FAD-binding protein [Clostridia bacterium]